jgi:hypothetical protein
MRSQSLLSVRRARSNIVTVTKYPCEWCGRLVPRRTGRGRPARFCKRSCRQRAYESRHRAAELGLNEDELVVTRADREALRDRLFVLAAALDDVDRDLEARGDDIEDRERAFPWLREAARHAVADGAA